MGHSRTFLYVLREVVRWGLEHWEASYRASSVGNSCCWVTHLILVAHGVQLLQLLGPVSRLLLRDVCEQSCHVLDARDTWPPSLGPWLGGVGSILGNPRNGWRWGGQEVRGSAWVGRTLKYTASTISVPVNGHWSDHA